MLFAQEISIYGGIANVCLAVTKVTMLVNDIL